MRHQILAIAVVLAITAAVAQPNRQSEPILAKVGNRVITESEFIRRFELTPGPSRQAGAKLEEEKAVALYSLVAEKLLAEEARRQGLDRDSLAIVALEGLRKVLARDELYRVEISQKVSVPISEIQTEARRALRELRVEYLYFEDSTAASVVRLGIRRGRPLSAGVFDSTAIGLYDTSTVIWGDADPAIEDEAYRLKEGEVSPVVHAGTGSYILRLLQSRPNPTFMGMQASVLKDRVEQKLRLRKERVRLDDYLAEVLKGKVGYGRPATMHQCVRALGLLAQSRSDSSLKLNPNDLAQLYRAAGRSLIDTMAVAGSKAWTLREMLDQLCGTGFSFSRKLKPVELGTKLSLQVRIWVEQELLEQEAIARHLDERREVLSLLDMWSDSYLAGRVKDQIRSVSGVQDDEVWTALRAEDPSVVLPRVRIEQLWTAGLDRMRVAMDSLSAGMPFSAAVATFGERPPGGGNERVEELSIGDRPPIGAIAWRMEVGRWYGPVRDGGGYMAFKLLEKILPPASADSGLQRKASAMRSTLEKAKKQGRLTYTIAALGKKTGFSVFEDRLSKITVTRLPMVTYKVIGFGGRMFAVPFVDRQVDWLDVQTKELLP